MWYKGNLGDNLGEQSLYKKKNTVDDNDKMRSGTLNDFLCTVFIFVFISRTMPKGFRVHTII